MISANALGCKICFLSEQRTELYKWYREGVAQLKNRFGAKNGLQSRALLDLGKRGA